MTLRARCGTGHGLDAAPYNETAPNLPDVTFIQGALTPSLPQRGIGVKLKKLEVNIIYVVSW